MPYIKQGFRDEIDKVEDLCMQKNYASSLKIKDFAGYLNYKIFSIVKEYIKVNGKSYFFFAVVCGTLVCCILEIYRKLIAKYEDEKIVENGDV